MLWARWIIFGIPVLLAQLTWWAAQQAHDSRLARGPAIVVASAEGIAPTLNPFAPSCEVDRQVAALVHEPLLRIGVDGRLAGALAERWEWSQTASFWFASDAYAQQALEKLSGALKDRWAHWRLAVAETHNTELRLLFSKPGNVAVADVAASIVDSGPLPVETIRVELAEPVRSYHEFFMQNAVEGAQVKDVWFDTPNSCELRVAGETLRFFEELGIFYQNRPALLPRVRLVAKNAALVQPVLKLSLRAGAVFHDGTPVTSADVEATVRTVLEQPWPVQGREALRLIRTMDATNPGTLKITWREPYGPALTAFAGLPVLPREWLEKHAGSFTDGRLFTAHPPPGAGICRLERADARAIFLGSAGATPGATRTPRVQFLLDQPPSAIRMGFAMKSVDAFWPGPASIARMSQDRAVSLRPAAPRSRLLVLWNCRSAPVDDPRVRAALQKAVDRPAMVASLLQGQGEIHEGVYRPDLWFAQTLPVEDFDPHEAKKMLYDLGWTKDFNERLVKGTSVFRIELLTVAGNAERMKVAKHLALDWARLGIETSIVAVSWEDLVGRRLPEQRFQATLLGLDFETTWDQSPFWHSTQVRRGLNYSGLADAKLDALLDALRAEFDLENIPALARETEQRIVDLHPFLPVFSGGTPLAIRKDALPVLQRDGGRTGSDLRSVIEATK